MSIATAPAAATRAARKPATMAQALRQALRDSLADDPAVHVLGEDVGTLGGVFRITDGLQKEFGEHRVTKSAGAAVRDLLDEVPQDAKVAVDGHTDSIGDDSFNDQLSKRRAQAVADVLRDARPDLRLTVKGHGERQPIAENEADGKDNPAGRAKNRRVEISYAGTAG